MLETVSDSKIKDLFLDFIKGWLDEYKQPKYRVQLNNIIQRGGNSLIIDYSDLSRYNSDLAALATKDPKYLEIFSKAALDFLKEEDPEYAKKVEKFFIVRIRNLPEKYPLRKLDVSLLGNLVAVTGIVVRVSEIKPYIIEAAWVCPNNHITFVPQRERSLKKPLKCRECDEKDLFKLDELKSVYVNFQLLRIQELPEELPPGQLPRQLEIKLYGDIVDVARPGDRVTITGILRAEEEYGGRGGRSRTFNAFIEGNYVEVLGKSPQDIIIEKADELKFKELAKRPDWMKLLISSFAPSIYGHDLLKEAILLLIVGAPQIPLPDGTTLRGDINILIVGDPGTAKSELLKYAARLAPRGLYTSGKGTTAAGLTAAVVREKSGMLMLEAGAVVLADQGVCAIDEFDKMSSTDRQALHEAMEQQTVSVAKGGIVVTLNARTSILSAANPLLGKYDPYKNLAENINLPSPLLTRFDLIFVIRDVPERSVDEQIASHIMALRRSRTFVQKPPLDIDFLRKYLVYCKNINPTITPEAEKMLIDFYLEMRSQSDTQGIPVTPRQLESLIRLAMARARLLLKDKVTEEDAAEAITLTKSMLYTVAVDKKTGKIDMGTITGMPASERSKLEIVFQKYKELSGPSNEPVELNTLIKALVETKKFNEVEAKMYFSQLESKGVFYMVKPGYYKRV
jgi:replicative DNA helicase Mcm